ncbi:ABC transporter substrate-binding protein [Hymenobacter tibetensis]|uniref:Thiamine pyrimidine synthase n=1 Tax=Hymenobacter tibetensis TaxID=497967 RepID=A0ABY4D270_9BACT|nr:ABC transporter substrate-binding protein [Hymenobacter tibetensis]UOG76432.1 ABC transporter substrate-binding protein [Hymenobacter tibetensis]
MEKLRVALDWTPNTNHTGFFVAQALGYYTENNLEIELVTPSTDHYLLTPAKRLELQEVDFAVAPIESAISLNTKLQPVAVKAIAALLQDDLSAIAVLERSGIQAPRQLDGKTYASYKARYEDDIVRKMIANDGGTGSISITYPDKLGIWDTLLAGQADATWIFMNWEGIEAETQGIALNYFKLSDYAIPYSYSPVLIARADAIEQKRQLYQDFLRATKKGYLYAKENLEHSTTILSEFVPEKDRHNIDLLKSQLYTGRHYGDETTWGRMNLSLVEIFVAWLKTHSSETSSIEAASFCSNELLT